MCWCVGLGEGVCIEGCHVSLVVFGGVGEHVVMPVLQHLSAVVHCGGLTCMCHVMHVKVVCVFGETGVCVCILWCLHEGVMYECYSGCRGDREHVVMFLL